MLVRLECLQVLADIISYNHNLHNLMGLDMGMEVMGYKKSA